MSKETEEIQTQINRLRNSVRFAKVKTLVADIEERLTRLELADVEPDETEIETTELWPSLTGWNKGD